MTCQKRYLDESKGVSLSRWWDDIDMLRGISSGGERLGYPTQKPLKLLERILEVSSNENDIVLDAFCGCGTALVAAQKLKRQWIGIDISPAACRVMAKRLRNVCALPESEPLWKAGRGFVVRDLPWTEAKLRAIPPFEFENWAVIALGGIPNKTQTGDMGIDGRIYPVSASATPRKSGAGELASQERWYPIQVKQKDKAGHPDIDAFETMMMREDCDTGFFVSFAHSSDAMPEIGQFFKRTGKMIRFASHRYSPPPPWRERAGVHPQRQQPRVRGAGGAGVDHAARLRHTAERFKTLCIELGSPCQNACGESIINPAK